MFKDLIALLLVALAAAWVSPSDAQNSGNQRRHALLPDGAIDRH
jgi:hypothetical protein